MQGAQGSTTDYCGKRQACHSGSRTLTWGKQGKCFPTNASEERGLAHPLCDTAQQVADYVIMWWMWSKQSQRFSVLPTFWPHVFVNQEMELSSPRSPRQLMRGPLMSVSGYFPSHRYSVTSFVEGFLWTEWWHDSHGNSFVPSSRGTTLTLWAF